MKKIVIALLLVFLSGEVLGGGKIIIMTSDYQSGNTSVYDIETGNMTDHVLPHYQDATVRVDQDRAYIIEGGDFSSVIASDVSQLNPPVYQYSVGTGSNPHDMVFYSSPQGTKAYVLRYNSDKIWVVDPSAQSQEDFKLKEIDISQWADSDGSPEAHQGFVHNGYIYVLLQRYDMNTWQAGTAILIRIDPETDTIADMLPSKKGLELIIKNPQGSLHGDKLYLAGTTYQLSDEGVAVVDLSSPDFSQSKLISESAIGGFAWDLIVFDEDKGLVFYYDQDWNIAGKSFDPRTGSLGSQIPVPNPGGGALYAGGKLYIGSRSYSAPGLYILDPSDYSVEVKPTSLPPYSMAFAPRENYVTVKEQREVMFKLERIYPNPVNSLCSINFSLDRTGNVKVEILDITGRRVETLVDRFFNSGTHSITWDTAEFSSGIYLIRLLTEYGSQTARAVVLK